MLEDGGLEAVEVFELCDKGDEIALKEVNKYYFIMAVGIYNIQYTYDPEVIILGGAISERDEYVDEINKRLDILMNSDLEGTIKPVLKKCEFGNDANKLGALYNYLQRQNKQVDEIKPLSFVKIINAINLTEFYEALDLYGKSEKSNYELIYNKYKDIFISTI